MPGDGNEVALSMEERLGYGLTVLNPQNSDRPFYHDFGEIPFGDEAECVLEVQNQEDVPLTIRSITPACGCTAPAVRWTDANGQVQDRKMRPDAKAIVLPPKAKAELRLKVDTHQIHQRNTVKLVNVRILTDSRQNPHITLELNMNAVEAMNIVPVRGLNLGQVPRNGGAAGKVEVVDAEPGSGHRVTGVLDPPAELQVSIEEREFGGASVFEVHVRLMPPLAVGLYRSEVVLATTGPGGEGEGRPIHVPITAQIGEDLIVSPASLQFALVKAGQGGRIQAQLQARIGGAQVRVVDSRIEGTGSEHLKLHHKALDPGPGGRAEAVNLFLELDPSAPAGEFGGQIVLELDDPETPELRIPYGGIVR